MDIVQALSGEILTLLHVQTLQVEQTQTQLFAWKGSVRTKGTLYFFTVLELYNFMFTHLQAAKLLHLQTQTQHIVSQVSYTHKLRRFSVNGLIDVVIRVVVSSTIGTNIIIQNHISRINRHI